MIDNEIIESLRLFMDGSPVNFWAVRSAARQLEYAGFSLNHLFLPQIRKYIAMNFANTFHLDFAERL